MTPNSNNDEPEDFDDLIGQLGRLDAEAVATTPSEPRPELRAEILAAVAAESTDQSDQDAPSPVASLDEHRRRRMGTAVLGALSVAAVAIIAIVLISGRGEPDTLDFAIVDPAFASQASFEWNETDSGWEVQVMIDGIPADEMWDLWVKPKGQDRINIASMTGGPMDGAAFVSPIGPEDAERVWVTDGNGDLVLDRTDL